MRDPDLWQRLIDYDLPEGFRARMVESLDWISSPDETAKVLAEYRRFLYVAALSPGSATPSPRIDEIWHLHLTDTKDYWERLCPQVLGRSLHHVPARDAGAERARHRAQYQETLTLYRAEFGTKPPEAYWPRARASRRGLRRAEALVFGGLALALPAMVVTQVTENEPLRTGAIALALLGILISTAPLWTRKWFWRQIFRDREGWTEGLVEGFGEGRRGRRRGSDDTESADCGSSCGGE